MVLYLTISLFIIFLLHFNDCENNINIFIKQKKIPLRESFFYLDGFSDKTSAF